MNAIDGLHTCFHFQHVLKIEIEKNQILFYHQVPNTSPTAASTGTDLNGMAVKNACEEILARLTPIKEKMPEKSWKEWIEVAYRDRISLSATGYYATPNIGYNHDKNEGNPFNYFTFGVAARYFFLKK